MTQRHVFIKHGLNYILVVRPTTVVWSFFFLNISMVPSSLSFTRHKQEMTPSQKHAQVKTHGNSVGLGTQKRPLSSKTCRNLICAHTTLQLIPNPILKIEKKKESYREKEINMDRVRLKLINWK